MGSPRIETPQNNYHIPVAEKLSELVCNSNYQKLLMRLFVDPCPNIAPLQLESPLPACRSFRPYRRLIGLKQQHRRTAAGGSRQVEREEPREVVRGRCLLVARLTEDIVKTFVVCNPDIRLPKPQKWYLTRPSQGVRNNGQDNENDDLILYHNCVLVDSASKVKFQVKNRLGNGAYGQSYRCSTSDPRYPDYVAVKIIKNDPIYSSQARYEVEICWRLNEKDPQDKHHIYRILNSFNYAGHKCLVFELLGMNLYELLVANHMRGLSTDDVQGFTRQILEALVAMGDAGVIHRDLKPENILLLPGLSQIKVIDFGSACMVRNKDSLKYIQSRFYRSPEVLLHLPYTAAIDMWSLGCVAAELFLGRPLFPAGCPYDLFRFMIDVLGSQPPDNMICDSKEKYEPEFFKVVSSAPAFQLLSEDEFEAGAKRKPQVGKRPFGDKNLDEMIIDHQIRKVAGMRIGLQNEIQFRKSFIDFLKGVLNFDPVKRWTPQQALQHPFITGENLAEWQPPCEKIQSYNGRALNFSPAIGGAAQMHSNATAYPLGLHASPDFIKYMHSSASNGPGMGSISGSDRYAGGYAISPHTYLHDIYSFHNGQPVNVRPPNNQTGFLGENPTPSYQLNPFYESAASSFYPPSYKSNTSSVHSSPIWSVPSLSSISYSSPSSQSQFSPQSQGLISPHRVVPPIPATVLPGAGNSVMRRFSPGSQHELFRSQHPDNGNVALTRAAVHRRNIRIGPGASRTAHPSSSTGARVGPLPAALNQTVHSNISKGSEALLFSPDLRQWHPRHSCGSPFGFPGEASSSKGRTEELLFSPDQGQRHPRYNGEQLFGDPAKASPSKGRSVPEVSTGKSGLPYSNMVPGDAGEASSSKGESARQNLTARSRFGNPPSSSNPNQVSYSTMVAGDPGEASSSSGKVSYDTMVAGDAGAVSSYSNSRGVNEQSSGISRLQTAIFRNLSLAIRSSGDPGETSSSRGRGVSEQSTGILCNLSYSNIVGGRVSNRKSSSRGRGQEHGQSTANAGQSRSKTEALRRTKR